MDTGKFSHLSSEYQSLYDQLSNGQRFGNPATNMNTICNARPDWGRNEANGFQTYAVERALNANHDAAMNEVNSTMIWR